MQAEKEFYAFLEKPENFPVSFTYGGKLYAGLRNCRLLSRKESERGGKTSVSLEYAVDETLHIRLQTAVYPAHGAYEWTVYFYNCGKTDSAVLEKVNAADLRINGQGARLKGILGDHENQYRPYDRDLGAEKVEFISPKGRASHVYFPYFNVQTESGGALLALGWGGTWNASFEYDGQSASTHVLAGGTLGMRTYLKPGECVRTPLVAVVRYFGCNEDAAMNAWRRWYVAFNMPKEEAGSPLPVQPHTSAYLAYDTGRPNSDGSISEYYGSWKRSLDAIFEHDIRIDLRWFDAGWYTDPYGRTVESDWFGTVGSWELDPVKWPQNTFRESVEYARAHGMKTFIWFEPEHVTHIDGLVKNYGYKGEWAISDGSGNGVYMNDLADPACLEWTKNRILRAMETAGADFYREDFNYDPAPYWAVRDARQGENRRGISENLYMQAHYALWDAIIAWGEENGKCTFIDSCASGGGCNDLESMRRAVSFLRSDSDRTAISLRLAMTASLVPWLPYTGVIAKESGEAQDNGEVDLYVLRASYLPHMCIQAAFYHDRDRIDWAALRQALGEWKAVSQYFFKDFYMLTPYRGTKNDEDWTAYMYFDAEKNEGVLQAFRPAGSTEGEYTVKLKGLDAHSFYCIRDADGAVPERKVRGSELLGGLRLYAAQPRTALLLYIRGC